MLPAFSRYPGSLNALGPLLTERNERALEVPPFPDLDLPLRRGCGTLSDATLFAPLACTTYTGRSQQRDPILTSRSLYCFVVASMPLELNGYSAHVNCDGKELETYDVRMEDERTISCWIPSEEGKVVSNLPLFWHVGGSQDRTLSHGFD